MPPRSKLSIVVAVVTLASLSLVVGCGGDDESASAAEGVPAPSFDRFDGDAAYRLVRQQVAMGPRPAGSAASRRLATRLRDELPNGRFQPVGGGLRNVVGTVPGRDPSRTVVVGAHYDTKDIPGFVGAVDAGSGTAVVTEMARTVKPRQLGPTVVFILFDGEEAPKGVPDSQFAERGLRGSKVAAKRYRKAEAMVLLDFVGERRLRIPREQYSDKRLWRRLRTAASDVGVGEVFPAREFEGAIQDDHLPFLERGVPSIDLIDFDFACWHETCDDMSQISVRSLDATGETVLQLLRTL